MPCRIVRHIAHNSTCAVVVERSAIPRTRQAHRAICTLLLPGDDLRLRRTAVWQKLLMLLSARPRHRVLDLLAVDLLRNPSTEPLMSDLVVSMQWPAMVVTVFASWLVGSTHSGRRSAGFWLFLLSNVLWVVWGWHGGAPALVVLQACLAAMNVRGMLKAKASVE